MSRILVIDLGNSSIKVGTFLNGRVQRIERVPTKAYSASECTRLIDKWRRKRSVEGACLCSVRPRSTKRWSTALNKTFKENVVVVGPQLDLGFTLDYGPRDSIGPDRLANAAGAWHRHGAPAVIADLGTAVNIDVIHRERGFIGGIIAPGRDLLLSALSDRAERLPDLEYHAINKGIGRSTREAMLLGVRWSQEGLIKEAFQKLAPAAGPGRVSFILTGGHAKDALKSLKLKAKYEQDLTLFGLGKIYEINRP